jgi:tetratricopeptide (TPR) repeat protein
MSAADGYGLDLGAEYSRPCGGNAAAQVWFDRGILWCFGFNHQEAVSCFAEAGAADPTCAMAWWGKAYGSGPNYNAAEPMMPPVQSRALADAATAVEMLDAASPEQLAALGPANAALIRALPARLGPVVDMSREARQEQDAAFEEAMAAVYAEHGAHDADVAFVYADALSLRCPPWRLWQGADEAILNADFECQQPRTEQTTRLLEVLEKGLALNPRHAGLCHLFVHACEMGPRTVLRGKTLAAARDCIRDGLVPDSGHLIHMASHIDVQLGEYARTIDCNQRAVEADLRFKARAGAAAHKVGVSTSKTGPAMYDLYCAHNYHFVIYAAMFTGQYGIAKLTAREMVTQLPLYYGAPVFRMMDDFLEVFLAVPLHVMVRFGRWHEILSEPLPPNSDDPEGEDFARFAATLSVQRYARGIALASLERVEEAEAEAELFELARAHVPPTRKHMIYNTYGDVLAVAAAMLAGEIAYRRGDVAVGFDLLREAVRLDATLEYEEPWSWMQPPRHALGALLLEQGEVEEAARVYSADLAAHPGGNIWALQGLVECQDRGGVSVTVPGPYVHHRF